MRLPKMEKSRQYRVTVPALNGGLNLQDAPNLVEDNQLTDVQNMWWKDQALRTRPGLWADEDRVDKLPDAAYTALTPAVYYLGGEPFRGLANMESETASWKITVTRVFLDGRREALGDNITLEREPDSSFEPSPAPKFQLIESSYKAKGCGFYMMLDVGVIFELNADMDAWIRLGDADLYAPLITVNGRGTDSDLYKPDAPNGTLFEGYNLLTAAFRAGFTSDGKGSRFVLPEKNISDEYPVTIAYGIFEWTIEPGNTESWAVTISLGDGSAYDKIEVKFSIDRNEGVVQTWIQEDPETHPSGFEKKPLPASGISNDLVITAFSSQGARGKALIYGMAFGAWFGGDRSGLGGGTRYFLSGNPAHSNLVHWSDTNNPLYFPENNYAYVGDSGQAVTAFGKQENLLVIFKERSLYYASYVAGTDFTAQDVIDGRVVDVAANLAKFPITPIHDQVGCDCPATVQLCSNRLVWFCKNCRVYVLCGANPYSERNVFELSEPIRRKLEAWMGDGNGEPFACDWQGHYLLMNGVRQEALVLNYNGNAFSNISSYADSRKAQRNLNWYFWKFDTNQMELLSAVSDMQAILLIGKNQKIISNPETGQKVVNDYLTYYSLEGVQDTILSFETVEAVRSIPCMFQTKQFDFGYPERRKTIRRLHLGASDTAGGHIALSYLTENGAQGDAYRLELYGEGDMREWTVTPGVSRVRRFGLRAESEGAMAVDNLTLRYEVGGEVR